jgi:hypothetical protein
LTDVESDTAGCGPGVMRRLACLRIDGPPRLQWVGPWPSPPGETIWRAVSSRGRLSLGFILVTSAGISRGGSSSGVADSASSATCCPPPNHTPALGSCVGLALHRVAAGSPRPVPFGGRPYSLFDLPRPTRALGHARRFAWPTARVGAFVPRVPKAMSPVGANSRPFPYRPSGGASRWAERVQAVEVD